MKIKEPIVIKLENVKNLNDILELTIDYLLYEYYNESCPERRDFLQNYINKLLDFTPYKNRGLGESKKIF